MTHRQLVEIAYKWLLKNGRVGVAFKELKSSSGQIPDVIGFDSWRSVLIECKVSRSDFLSDKKKPHHDRGMGNWRFYCCPKGMIKVSELPKGWGLIYVDEKSRAKVEYDCRIKQVPVDDPEHWFYKENNITHRTVKDGENWFECDRHEEQKIMYTALRRLMVRGLIKHIYDGQRISVTANDIINSNKLFP